MNKNKIINPIVSIIIPSFNQGEFLDETIRSILDQYFHQIEIIIIDAMSTDNTKEILEKYGAEIKWISEKDNGHADGVNKGFSLGTGEIFGWINADDVYCQHSAIQKVVETFNKKPEIDIVYGDGAIIAGDGTLLRLWLVPRYNKKRIQRGNMIIQPTVFFRRNVVMNEKLKLNSLVFDYEYWLRLGEKGYRFFHINELIAADRYHLHRVSVQRRVAIKNEERLVRSTYSDVNQKGEQVIRFIDRFHQSLCRLKGVLVILNMLLKGDLQNRFSFNLKIDSPYKLIYRQLFHSVIFDQEVMSMIKTQK